MAVEKATKPEIDVTAPLAVSVPVVDLELSAHGRYVYLGNLYEKGVKYTFTREQAGKMLRLQADNGIPVFKRYQPKQNTKLMEVKGPSTVDMSQGKPNPEDVQAKLKADRLEIGTEDEIQDILDEIEKGDLTRGDLGDGVRVS